MKYRIERKCKMYLTVSIYIFIFFSCSDKENCGVGDNSGTAGEGISNNNNTIYGLLPL